MACIIYKNESGGVSIVYPTGEVSIDTLISTVVPQDAEYKVVDASEIPTDRTFRNAWEFVSEPVEETQEVTE